MSFSGSLYRLVMHDHINPTVNKVGWRAGMITACGQVPFVGPNMDKWGLDPLSASALALGSGVLVKEMIFVGNDLLVRPIARRFGCQMPQNSPSTPRP